VYKHVYVYKRIHIYTHGYIYKYQMPIWKYQVQSATRQIGSRYKYVCVHMCDVYMCTNMYTNVSEADTYVYVYIDTFICISIHIYTYVYLLLIHLCTYLYTYIHVHHICASDTYTCICIYVYKYVHQLKKIKRKTCIGCKHKHVSEANMESSAKCDKANGYGVATVSRIDTIIGLFCRISSLLWGSFAKRDL